MEQLAAANIMAEDSLWRKGKYKKTIIEAMSKWLREDDDSTQEESENLAYNILGYAGKYLPDLYAIDEETRTIRLLEIEDTSKLTKEKIAAYADFWHDSDYYEIALEIYTADRYGRNIQPLKLWPTFCHSLSEQNEKDSPMPEWSAGRSCDRVSS